MHVEAIQPSRWLPPDWRTESAYHHLLHAGLVRIAWEFLRRNPDYVAAWESFQAAAAKLDEGAESVVEAGDGWPAGTLMPLTRREGLRWGLEEMECPSASTARFADSANRYVMGVPSMVLGPDALGRVLWLRLDLTLPTGVLQSQAVAAIRGQKQVRRDAGRLVGELKNRPQEPRVYVEYLRILDAHSLSNTVSCIGAHLAPGDVNSPETRGRDKRFRAKLKAAMDLRDGGYRALPMLEFRGWKSAPAGKKN